MNHDGKIDYMDFCDRFHEPAKEIGFNLAILLTNLSEHMPNEPRLARFLETASSVLNYFEPFLGRIEILGSSKKIERVYFEIKESNIEQWEKPQIKESKRAFFYSIVTEGGDKEKLEAFVNFCEDAIFEMTHASEIMATDEKSGSVKRETAYRTYISDEDEERANRDPIRKTITSIKEGLKQMAFLLSPTNIKHQIGVMQTKSIPELIVGFFKLIFYAFYYTGYGFYAIIRYFFNILMNLMRGPAVEEEELPLVAEIQHLPTLALPPVPDEHQHAASSDSNKEDSGGESIGSGPDSPVKDDGSGEGTSAEKHGEVGDGDNRVEPPMTLQDLLGGEAAKAAEKERSEAQKVQEAAMASIESENRKSTQCTTEPTAVQQIDFSQYAHKAVSFLARNFYNLKYVALVLAFCINFMLLFYKVTTFGEENEGSGDSDLGTIDVSGSGSGAGVDLGSAEGSSDTEEEDPLELVQVDEVYIEYVMRCAAALHSLVSLCMLIAYYHLKVPLAIFKREKEIARRLEFDGLFIAEHPEDDDIKSHWDKLVISSKR